LPLPYGPSKRQRGAFGFFKKHQSPSPKLVFPVTNETLYETLHLNNAAEALAESVILYKITIQVRARTKGCEK
jgi:hypothetical protein